MEQMGNGREERHATCSNGAIGQAKNRVGWGTGDE